MKAIKYICLLIFLMFGIIMQTEIFQNQLWNFETAYWVASRCDFGHTETAEFVKDVKAVSSEHDVHVFSFHMEMRSNYNFCLNIYGDDEVIRRAFRNKAGVEEGVYTSLISGITEVKFHDFEEMCDAAENSPTFDNMIVYIGEDDDIRSVYEELSGKYDLTEPQLWESTEKDMMIIVWGLIAILMIVMNVVSAVRRKKEVIVRASLGESVTRIVFTSALMDAALDILKSAGYMVQTLAVLIQRIESHLKARVNDTAGIGAVIFSYQHNIILKTSQADDLIQHIRKES